MLGGLLHMAGQIGLDPPTMQLVPGGLQAQLLRYCHHTRINIAPSLDQACCEVNVTITAPMCLKGLMLSTAQQSI